MKKKVKLDLEVLELEAKIAPKNCECDVFNRAGETGGSIATGAEC